MRYLRSTLLCCLFFLGTHTQAETWTPPEAQDPNQLEYELLTVGMGSEIYARYGHTIVRVIDRAGGADYNFNWGIFDYAKPNFAWNFFRGILIYQLGTLAYNPMLRHYRSFEKRPVWAEKINLTPSQRKQLFDLIRENTKPENYEYPYQYFFNNCATIPRDHLDKILGGRIRAEFGQRPAVDKSGKVLRHRDYVLSNLSNNPIVGFGLDILMNSNIDHPMTAWEEMFFPIKLREHLATLPAYDDQNRPIANSHLITDRQTVVDLPETFGATYPYLYPVISALILMLTVLSLVMKDSWSIFLGCGLLLYGVLGLTFGAVMLLAWIVSAHMDLHHNVNLALLPPTHAVFIFFGILWLKRKSLPIWATPYMLLSIGTNVLVAVLWVVGFVQQDVSRSGLMLGLPCATLLAASVVRQRYRLRQEVGLN